MLCYVMFKFLNGHVTQELACVMAAISMAPNVTVNCHDAVDTVTKWYKTWIQLTACILCPFVCTHFATKDPCKAFYDLFASRLRHTAFLMRSTSPTYAIHDLAKPISHQNRNRVWFQRNNCVHFPVSMTTTYQAYVVNKTSFNIFTTVVLIIELNYLHYTNVYSLVENAPVLVLILNRHWSLIDWTSPCLMKTGLRSIRHEPSALSIQIQTVWWRDRCDY